MGPDACCVTAKAEARVPARTGSAEPKAKSSFRRSLHDLSEPWRDLSIRRDTAGYGQSLAYVYGHTDPRDAGTAKALALMRRVG